MNNVLIITGMHRSGTSLIANWLGQSGMNLGARLIGATPSNKLGHFEDIEIVEFHEDLLRYNSTNLYEGIGESLTFSDEHIKRARELTRLRNEQSINWGWKQPRAALFLDLWLSVLPTNTYFLFPFRPYQEVVGSLFRREYNKIALKNPEALALIKQREFLQNEQQICDKYLSMWIRHNSEVLSAIPTIGKNKHVIISLNNFIDNHHSLLKKIQSDWGFEGLKVINFGQIYEPKLLNQEPTTFSFNPSLQTEAEAISKALIKRENEYLR